MSSRILSSDTTGMVKRVVVFGIELIGENSWQQNIMQ